MTLVRLIKLFWIFMRGSLLLSISWWKTKAKSYFSVPDGDCIDATDSLTLFSLKCFPSSTLSFSSSSSSSSAFCAFSPSVTSSFSFRLFICRLSRRLQRLLHSVLKLVNRFKLMVKKCLVRENKFGYKVASNVSRWSFQYYLHSFWRVNCMWISIFKAFLSNFYV